MLFRKVIFLVAIFFGYCIITTAQSKKDSLQNRIANHSMQDTLLARWCIELGYEYHYGGLNQFDSILYFAEKAENISRNKKWHKGVYLSMNLKAQANYSKGSLKNSVKINRENISYQQKNNQKKYEFYLKDNLAYVLAELGEKDEALKFKLDALDYFIEIKDSNSINIALSGISWIYMTFNDYKKAKHWQQKALKIAKMPNLIENCGNMGIIYEKLDMLDSALYYALKADSIGQKYPGFILANNVELAEIYRKQGKIDLSIRTLQKVHDSYDTESKEKDYQITKLSLVKQFIQRQDYTNAKKYLETINEEMVMEDLSQRRDYGKLGMDLYRNSSATKTLHFTNIYYLAKDSLNNIRRDSIYQTIEKKYNVAKKQEVINEQKIRLRNYGIGLISLLGLALIGGLLFFNYKKRQDLQQKLVVQENIAKESEIENLKKENKLISMQSMIEGQEEERKRIAQDLHDNIGTLMTTIKMKFMSIQEEIESIQKMNITNELDTMISNASAEVRRISHRMTPKILEHTGLRDSVKELELQLAENNIEVKSSIDILEEIKNDSIELQLYRALQEIYNNIVKHSQATKVSVVADIKDNNLIIRVRDNGIGLSQEKWESKNTLGLEGIKSRIAYLNGEIKRISEDGMHLKISIPLT